jgi:hypothetical protein
MSAIGPLLAHDRADRYRSLGAFGKPAWQSHVQLRAMLLGRGLRQLADYFARPVHDPDRAELRWTSERAGEVRRLDELAPDARVSADATLERFHRELHTLVAELRTTGEDRPGGAASFGSLLEQAMRVPAQGEFLSFVGEQPVIAFWGFADASGRSVDPTEPRAGAPAAAAPPAQPAPPAPASLPPTPPPAEPVPVDEGIPFSMPARRRAAAWWLLLALPLLVLAWWLLRACAPATPLVIGADGVPKTEGRKAGKLLEIPPGALERGDLSFLEGVWQLGEERVGAYRGSPNNVVGSDRIVLRFGRDGTGTNHGVERLRGDRRVADCSGALQARTDGKKLYFERQVCQVPGQPALSVQGSRHECVIERNGKTSCYGINSDGVRWEAPLARLT